MSYVERAFYDYFINTMTAGVKTLFSRRFIFYTILLFIFIAGSTGAAILYERESGIMDEELLLTIYAAEMSLALGLIFSGIIAKQIKFYIGKWLATLVFTGVIFVIFMFDKELKKDLLEWTPLICLGIWAFVGVIASYVFSKNLFASKTTGSILFLGKPSGSRSAIFIGPIIILIIGSALFSILLLQKEEILTGLLMVLSSFLIMLVAFGLFFEDDVFNTILSFFFIFNLPHLIFLGYLLYNGEVSNASSFSFVLLAITFLYSIQGVSKKAKKADKIAKKVETKEEDEEKGWLDKIMGWLGGEGMVLPIIGFAMGYHVIQLEILTKTVIGSATTDLIGDRTVPFVYHSLCIVLASILIFLVPLLYLFSSRFRGYTSPSLWRFDWLPPYEELKDFFERAKAGEVNWKRLTASIAAKTAKKSMKKAQNRVLSFLGIRRKKKERWIQPEEPRKK